MLLKNHTKRHPGATGRGTGPAAAGGDCRRGLYRPGNGRSLCAARSGGRAGAAGRTGDGYPGSGHGRTGLRRAALHRPQPLSGENHDRLRDGRRQGESGGNRATNPPRGPGRPRHGNPTQQLPGGGGRHPPWVKRREPRQPQAADRTRQYLGCRRLRRILPPGFPPTGAYRPWEPAPTNRER